MSRPFREFLAFLCALAALVMGAAGGRAGSLHIEIAYEGPDQFHGAIAAAAAKWESLLVGYQDGVIATANAGSSYETADPATPLSTVYLTARVAPLDGPGSVLAQARPVATVWDVSGFCLASDGLMEFDDVDAQLMLDSGSFSAVALHEMAHALGFGTLWSINDVYVPGSGEFTGASATAAWESEFAQPDTPDVELEGEAGTANRHWNENYLGIGPTGIVDPQNHDLRYELMTGWFNADPFISRMTVASFVDIGFIGAPSVAEPASLALGGVALAALRLIGRRRTPRVSD